MNRTIVAAVLASVVAVGCSDAFTPSGVAGTYNLTSVDGNAIPWTNPIQPTAEMVTVESGRLTLNADATWLISLTSSRFDGNTRVTDTITASGTYTLTEPNTIELQEPPFIGATVGTVDGDRITLDLFGFAFNFGFAFVFEK